MFDTKTVSLEWGGKTLTLETGRIARQADGAVLATYGETVVLCAVTAAKSVKEGQDFFPLTVHYQEKFSSAGRIPGGFFKRERGATEKETLTSRLIDRPVRPLFPEGFYNEINVIAQVFSYDGECEPDVLAMIAASAALTISGVPFMGPIGACRVGFKDGEYILNPKQTSALADDGRLDLVVAATGDAVMMVESEAKELTEAEMLGAVAFAHDNIRPVVNAIVDLAEQAARDPWDVASQDGNEDMKSAIKAMIGKDIEAAYKQTDKSARSDALNAARDKVKAHYGSDEFDGQQRMTAIKLTKKLEAEIVRGAILKDGTRIDGRKLDQVRPIEAMVGVLPRAHGSSLFTRGETQALCSTTLGTKDSEQMIDGLEGLSYNNFMLHYNFPPYSVGEVGRVGGPGRREIGHGKLAWRALQAVLPASTDFPYTIRVVSEITESNGSSSMASVCGGSLSMMDAGVPLKAPVAGVAMGLILEEDGSYAILSDILGDEDHLGDMDFKVAGTEAGITSLQMDIKIAGITPEIMEKALAQAKAGRVHILGEMNKAISGAGEFSVHAPRIETMQIPTDKIREVIGSGGKVIREIVEVSGAKVDINDEGIIKIASPNGDSIKKAYDMIWSIVAEPEEGAVYTGTVVKIVDFGAFVNFFGKRDGLVHVSQIENRRLNHPSDVLKEGQEVKVKLLGFDDRGKVRLSMKVVDQETGEEIKKEEGGEA